MNFGTQLLKISKQFPLICPYLQAIDRFFPGVGMDWKPLPNKPGFIRKETATMRLTGITPVNPCLLLNSRFNP